MTTKLLPRLLATGVVAAALTGVSLVTDLVTTGAHAGTPVVTAAGNGGLDEHLTYDQVRAAAAEQHNAQDLCQNVIVPAADLISPGTLHWTTCTTFTHYFSSNLVSKGSPIVINYDAGRVTARLG